MTPNDPSKVKEKEGYYFPLLTSAMHIHGNYYIVRDSKCTLYTLTASVTGCKLKPDNKTINHSTVHTRYIKSIQLNKLCTAEW